MKIGILVDILDEHSGARATPQLVRALAEKSTTDEFVILTKQNRLPLEAVKSFPVNVKIIIFRKSLFLALDLWHKIKLERINIISAHCSLRLLITARFAGVRIVRTDYGTQFPSLNNSFYSWKTNLTTQLLNRLGDLWVYFRDGLKFNVSHLNLGISLDNSQKSYWLYGQKIDFIYLGCNNFNRAQLAGAKVGSPLKIISISRFVPYKGFHILIDAFKNICSRHQNLELVLIGGQAGGRYWDFLKKLAGGWPNIKILLNPDDHILTEYLSSSHIYASGTRWEGLGLPFLEASLFGLPTLGFDFFGPAQEVIKDDETGLLAQDFNDFQNKLERLVADGDLRYRLGKSGREFAAQFTWEKTAQAYLEVFKRTVL